MSWAEDKFDATRQSEDEKDFGDDWVCHDCALGDTTPWNPAEGCPRYPCHAHRRAACAKCPVCGKGPFPHCNCIPGGPCSEVNTLAPCPVHGRDCHGWTL